MSVTSAIAGPLVALVVVLPLSLKLTEPTVPSVIQAKAVAEMAATLDKMQQTLKDRDCLDRPTKGE